MGLPFQPLPDQRNEPVRRCHLEHGAEGEDADQEFRLVLPVIAQRDLVFLFPQPDSFLLQMGEVEQDPLQGVPLVPQAEGEGFCVPHGLPAQL